MTVSTPTPQMKLHRVLRTCHQCFSPSKNCSRCLLLHARNRLSGPRSRTRSRPRWGYRSRTQHPMANSSNSSRKYAMGTSTKIASATHSGPCWSMMSSRSTGLRYVTIRDVGVICFVCSFRCAFWIGGVSGISSLEINLATFPRTAP